MVVKWWFRVVWWWYRVVWWWFRWFVGGLRRFECSLGLFCGGLSVVEVGLVVV